MSAVTRASVVAVLVVLALTGCRGAGRVADSGVAGNGTAPAAGPSATHQGPGGGAGVAGAGTAPSDGTGGGSAAGGSAAGDLAAVDRDLEGLSSADAAVGSDLDAAASDAAQPDNG
jgi:hypothetical protein